MARALCRNDLGRDDLGRDDLGRDVLGRDDADQFRRPDNDPAHLLVT